MSLVERLFQENHAAHFTERNTLLRRLECAEDKLASRTKKLAEVNYQGVKVHKCEIPAELRTINRLTDADSEIRVDLTLSDQEIKHAPVIIKEVFRTMEVAESDDINTTLVLPMGEDSYKHFGLIFTQGSNTRERLGIVLTSDPDLNPFIIRDSNLNGRYEKIRHEFSANNGLWDTRQIEILCEAAEWLPKVIEKRKVVFC